MTSSYYQVVLVFAPLFQWCSGAYSTLYGFGVLKLPSERTLRDYWHVAFAAAFTKDNDYRTQTLSSLCQCLPCYSKLILQHLGEAKV